MSRGCSSDSFRAAFVFAASKNAASLWNLISYSPSCSNRCGWCGDDWLVSSEISGRQSSDVYFWSAEPLFVHSYEPALVFESCCTFFDLHGASNTHLKETDKYFVYCVQGTEIQPVISDVFKSYWEHFRQTGGLYKTKYLLGTCSFVLMTKGSQLLIMISQRLNKACSTLPQVF